MPAESILYYKVRCSGYAGRIEVRVERDAGSWKPVWFKPTPLE
jgi:hypothetical protein